MYLAIRLTHTTLNTRLNVECADWKTPPDVLSEKRNKLSSSQLYIELKKRRREEKKNV